jgi:arylsulfatase A-like enzyme
MQPNIILIVVDSLRFDHVGPQNGSSSLTPNLDALSAEAIVFEQAISQGPSTRVAMSALMSSTYASLYGGQKRLPPNRPVIQAMLKNVGYTTAGITSNLYLSQPFGWNRGFDYYDDCRPENVYHRKIWLRGFNQVAKLIGMPLGWPRSLPVELVFENASRFLQDAQQPFFLWIHLMDVHWPYTIQRFSWNAEWRRKREADRTLRPRLVSRPPQISQEEHKTLLAEYREAVQYTDKHIGSYAQKLKKDGLLKDSWLVIIADHGEEFLEHGQYFHHPTLHEELVHVPLIIRPPDNSSVKRGYRYASQVRSIDLVPTFLDIAQASPLPDAQLFGESLLPILRGESNEDRPALIESPENQTLALRYDGWKYIWHIKTDQRLLFNLAEDPGEQNNLSAANPSGASAMHEQLEKHLQMVREANQSTDGYEEPEIDQEIIERLKDLGYVE